MNTERRKHTRFSATAFLNKTVNLKALPPFFGHAVKGKMIDLSAGGMAILIDELIPQETLLEVTIKFPDQTVIDSVVKVRHVLPRGKKFLHGFEFLTLNSEIAQRIEKMSSDYIDCDQRIHSRSTEVCRQDCAFFTLCSKEQKLEPVLITDSVIDLQFNLQPQQVPAAKPE